MDPARETDRVSKFIRATVKEAGADGVVVGLSGGIDSAVVGALCVRALGKDRVTAVLMPSKFTARADIEDAEVLAYTWGVRVKRVEISPLADLLTSSFDFEPGKVPSANVQARLRMVILYLLSNSSNLLVVGTGDKSEELLGFFCYDSHTRVVTTEGPKGMDELKPGDTVFSMKTDSREMVEAMVDEVFAFDYDDELIHFRGKGTDLLVTPNHRMLVQASSSNSDSAAFFREADKCLEFKRTLVPLPSLWAGRQGLPLTLELAFEQDHLERTVHLSIEDVMYLFGLFIGGGCAVEGKSVGPVKSNLTRLEHSIAHRDRSGRFSLLPLADVEEHMKECETFETDFSLPDYTKQDARTRLREILNRYEIGYFLTRNVVRISSKGVYDLFAQCGVGARNKHIPRWLLEYPSKYLLWLLRGLKDSDATHPEDQNVYYTSSDRLKDDFVELCFKTGRRATVSVRGPRSPVVNGKTIRTGRSYEISFAKKARLQHTIDNARARRVKYSGKVWCPSVPPHENILVERHGRYTFSGNTKFGDGGADLLPIAHLYKTQVRALGSHLGLPERVVTKPASPGLWEGHTAAEELPADYGALDPLLHFMFDRGLQPREAAKKSGVTLSVARKAMEMHEKTEHKRSLPPSLA